MHVHVIFSNLNNTIEELLDFVSFTSLCETEKKYNYLIHSCRSDCNQLDYTWF